MLHIKRERERASVLHTHTQSLSVQHSNSGKVCFLNVVILNRSTMAAGGLNV